MEQIGSSPEQPGQVKGAEHRSCQPTGLSVHTREQSLDVGADTQFSRAGRDCPTGRKQSVTECIEHSTFVAVEDSRAAITAALHHVMPTFNRPCPREGGRT